MAKKVVMRIMRVGKFKDSKGKEHEFTGEGLKTIADGFSFSGEEDAIPDIISHDNKSPRVGFVKKVYLGDEGNSLFAESEIHDDFAQAISEGFYPSVSVRLSADGTKIQHIAHLGKEKPAIKGLGLPFVEFSETGESIDFAEINLELFEQISSIAMKELHDALWRIQDQQREILTAIKNANGENSFSESDLAKENEKLKAQIQANKEKLASDFAEQLIADGKILPASKKVVVRDFMACETDSDFSEFKAEYEKLPVLKLFNGTQKPDNNGDSSDFSSEELGKRARDFMAQEEKNGRTITFIDAIDVVKKKG